MPRGGVCNRAVFLDRDGTIIEDVDYLTDLERIRLLPGVVNALRRLRAAGYLLIVVTNQSAIARGWLTEGRLADIHAELNRQLQAEGTRVDAYYYCPHLPDAAVNRYSVVCDCRKPEPGMLRRATREWHVDPAASFMVGDSERDAEAGRRAGCRPILVGGKSGHATGCPAVPGLREAADLILGGRP